MPLRHKSVHRSSSIAVEAVHTCRLMGKTPVKFGAERQGPMACESSEERPDATPPCHDCTCLESIHRQRRATLLRYNIIAQTPRFVIAVMPASTMIACTSASIGQPGGTDYSGSCEGSVERQQRVVDSADETWRCALEWEPAAADGHLSSLALLAIRRRWTICSECSEVAMTRPWIPRDETRPPTLARAHARKNDRLEHLRLQQRNS